MLSALSTDFEEITGGSMDCKPACAVSQDHTAPVSGLSNAAEATRSPGVSALCILAGCNGSKRCSKTCTVVIGVFSHMSVSVQ